MLYLQIILLGFNKLIKNLVIFIDMDNPILIALIIIGSVIYKIYQGYKEEQEKAKKRMEQLKKQLQKDSPFQEISVPVPAVQPAKTVSKTTLVSHKNQELSRDIPQYDEVEIARQRKLEQQRIAAEKRLKQEKSKTATKRIELEVLEGQHFDLRQAVIQQAILERPYKD